MYFRGLFKLLFFHVFSHKVINICRTESYNLSFERKSNDLPNEYNESSSLERCHQLKWQKLNFRKIGCGNVTEKQAFLNAGIH